MSPPELSYDSPETFTFRQRMLLTLGCPLLAGAYKALCVTCRQERRGEELFQRSLASGQHVFVAFWHETLGLAAWLHRNTGFHTLTSYSFDGEVAARVVRSFGLYAVRGSSSRGGYEALRQMQRAVDKVPAVGFTLDGPTGPRRVAKPGAAILAIRTGVPIVPLALAASSCWRLHSWDQLIIPKPFGRILSIYGDPILPPPKGAPKAIEQLRSEVERALNRLHASLEEELGQES
ncbi:MAG TPA: lysophospholipid acyltransferase family protein [Candidatus Hydrogenedentes bacterium]|nr:lysophospholipid acyltransferase family protein [Candidatus Hydrogenedentota bacterium]HPK00188.1 lysophospholipid acyltransferase family protein [Candidatus Hydrogenedentota bacterium]